MTAWFALLRAERSGAAAITLTAVVIDPLCYVRQTLRVGSGSGPATRTRSGRLCGYPKLNVFTSVCGEGPPSEEAPNDIYS